MESAAHEKRPIAPGGFVVRMRCAWYIGALRTGVGLGAEHCVAPTRDSGAFKLRASQLASNPLSCKTAERASLGE